MKESPIFWRETLVFQFLEGLRPAPSRRTSTFIVKLMFNIFFSNCLSMIERNLIYAPQYRICIVSLQFQGEGLIFTHRHWDSLNLQNSRDHEHYIAVSYFLFIFIFILNVSFIFFHFCPILKLYNITNLLKIIKNLLFFS